MKIRSLLLGSVAAAGLSTGAYAADLGVLTSLDLCDDLGISGLTISSDTNCLAITGEVKYTFKWGDYVDGSGPDVNFAEYSDLDWDAGDGEYDWDSRVDAWIKFVATANSDFGPAKAVIKIKDVQQKTWDGNGGAPFSGSGSSTSGPIFDEAYVSIGDTTVLMAGKKGSIINKDDDEPLNWLGLFHSEAVDTGVGWGDSLELADGGHVIQVTHDLGNGVSISGGLEALNASEYSDAGTAVGVLAYAGDGMTAHVTFAAGGVLDGVVEDWAMHAGFTGTFDMFKVVGAAAFSDDSGSTFWNVLGSVSATFDMFTLAVSGEMTSEDEWGVGGSISAAVTDGVTLNAGARYFDEQGAGTDYTWQGAVGMTVAVTESVTLEASAGYVYENWGGGTDDLFYGMGKASWAPGGGFTASVAASANTDSAYKVETEFKKTFE